MRARVTPVVMLLQIVMWFLAPSAATGQHRMLGHMNRTSGDWSGRMEDDAGAMGLTIGRDGALVGYVLDRASGRQASLEGDLDRSGRFAGTLTYRGAAPLDATGVVRAERGGLDVSIDAEDGPEDIRFEAFLRRQSNNQSPGARYSGEYSGAWSGITPAGAVNVTIRPNGRISGTLTHPTNAALTGTLEGDVLFSGDTYFTVTNRAGTTTAVGVLDRHGNDLSVEFTANTAGTVTTHAFTARRSPGTAGGSGGGGQSRPVVFTGSWAGTAVERSAPAAMELEVHADGSVEGVIGDGEISGRISGPNRAFEGVIAYPSGNVVRFRGEVRGTVQRLEGTVLKSAGMRRFQSVSFVLHRED